MPSLARNRLSIAGLIIAIIVLADLLSLVGMTVLGVELNPYVGIFAYLIGPAIMIFGLLLIPVGMLLERRRRRKFLPGELPAFPKLDLNEPSIRRGFFAAAGFSLFFVVLSMVASYQGYQFTDSVMFCGQTCHVPMKPEYTAYEDSPHARVPCAGCHVGPGATWFVRSKLSGAYQVYAVMFNKYPRPIETPIKDLRPVQAACEQCHWPQKFYGAQLKVFAHYGYDEKNTPTRIQMLIKTGGGSAEFGRATGIHWHMNIANQVWFAATDKQSQVIPWVKVTTPDGRTTEYLAKGSSLTPQQIAAMPTQRMDCVSCHARPSHKFLPPDQAVDAAFEGGQIDPTLPFLKRQAVKALVKRYTSPEQAAEGIATALDTFYRNRYAPIYAAKWPQIRAAIAAVQQIYKKNMFPFMRVDWRTHPDNIGHLYYSGCFRCHDGQHVSADGRVIPQACDSCHTVLATPTSVAEFKHPIDVGDTTCSTCHTGGVL
ncbi:NapC/NirT family cytochrome c [Candidatus Binatus sp.]|uniref:NapC/NirT family cytochrome c n=1 Tax=Candidatus Binatus sp. TaxID=2811406 RepID=UPI002F91CF91